MSIEHEAKFRLDDCLVLQASLLDLGRLRTPWHFESNTVYDRKCELAESGRLLRLRRALTATLTFKAPSPGPTIDGIKSRIEHTSRVEDPQAMDAILRGLGYAPRLCYEKFRCEWDLPQGLLFLDILPFGHFLEIESSPEAIVPIARGLDLDPRTALDKSYHSLHQSWRRLNGLDASEDFVFDEGERQRLTISLGLSARPAGENNAQ